MRTRADRRSRVRRALMAAGWGVALTAAAGCTDPGSGAAAAAPTTTTTVAVTTTTVRPDPAPAITVTGPISEPTRVGPAPGSELDGIDRDAGVSVRLRDGSTLWLFGDTATADTDGSLVYFEIGTAAWSAPGSPTVTNDVAVDGEPVAFAEPGMGFPPCPPWAPVGGMWPSSAIVQPVGDLDRVVVWMENICLGSSTRGAARGMSVAEWIYDPSAPPVDRPIRGRVLNQTLFPERSYGLASMPAEDGHAFVYWCVAPEQGGPPEQYGPCRVAKVALDRAADLTAYRVWDGASFVSDPAAARPMEFDPGPIPAPYPAGSFSVVRDPHAGAFVMVYSPWPGYSDSLMIRTADSPMGPWSAPAAVPLPGCSDTEGSATFWCYAAAAQPIFSEPGKLGIGYYDRRVSSGPVRGSYLVATVPYSLPSG